MTNNLVTIEEDEFEDFIHECEAREMNYEEFNLDEHDIIETEINAQTFIVNGKLTITRGEVSRTYLTGDSADWLVGFAKDLRDGVFNGEHKT